MRIAPGPFRFFAPDTIVWILALSVGGSVATSSPRPASSVRFHHFHFRVEDPARSMNDAATSLNGSRVLLRGLGVGARIGREYVLFDRFDVSATTSELHPPVAVAYDAARRWLMDHGVEVESAATSAEPALAAMFAAESLDHVAFTSVDTSVVVSSLLAHGAKASRQTDDSRFFRTDMAGVEIVRDVDAPDAFWCPMHPDMRSSVAGRCPLCLMELVPIPSPSIGEYGMDVAITPGATGRGVSKL